MGIAEVTVKVHRHNLMQKLVAKSFPDLVKMADELGLAPKFRTKEPNPTQKAPLLRLASPPQ
jgi:phage terminase small subunit